MKRYLYGAVIKSVSGSQTFYIDAASQEEADERAREGDTDGIHSEDVEVTDLYELEPCGVTNLGDFGDFPPDAAQPAQQGAGE